MQITPNNSYSFGERVFRTAVFQAAVYNAGKIERFLIWLFNAIAQFTYRPKLFDAERAEKGINGLNELGAKIQFVTPKDGKAKIQMMTLNAVDLEKRINQFGGKWEKVTLSNNQSVFAIIPPESISREWKQFEKNLLRLKWKKKEIEFSGKKQDVIVTCEDASCISKKDEYANLFMHSNSASVSFIMLASRIGFYLGCKQNVCFYDPRGTWKSVGTASEAGYYNDISAVYEQIKDRIPAKNIWVTSACGGVPAAAYLKSQVHSHGVNFIFENGFASLKEDYVDPEPFIVRKLAYANWKGIASKDIEEQFKPEETGFNLHQLWRQLGMTDMGKVVVVRVNNDQRLSPSVDMRLVNLAKKVNAKVFRVAFDSKTKDPHSDRYYTHSKQASEALSIIFAKS